MIFGTNFTHKEEDPGINININIYIYIYNIMLRYGSLDIYIYSIYIMYVILYT